MNGDSAQISDNSPTNRRKPRVCPYCKRSFRRYEHLQRHLRLHTNEKPYKCDCGASYSRQDLLKRHQSIGHAPITPETPDPSPTAVPDSTNGQSQVDLSYVGARQSLLQPIDHQNSPTAPISQDDPLDHGQYEGNSLFSSQDLLLLQDLEVFCDNLGPDNEWYLPSYPSIVQIFAGDTHSNSNALPTPSIVHSPAERPSASEQMLSRLPAEREAVAEFGVLTFPILTVTSQQRNRLLQALVQCHSSDASGSLPSCHSLSRFINGFLDGFYPHMPVVHMPTFKICECEPEVLLAMCALGAQFRHENRKAVILFHAARDILQYKARGNEVLELACSSGTANQHVPTPSRHTSQYRKTMDQARCAFLLIALAAWQCDESIAREAFNLQSFLARCVRECGLGESKQQPPTNDWHSWIQEEADRRVKLFSFAFLNLQSLAFGTPPAILADEINLRLPCSCLEWIAPDEQKWNLVRRPGHREQMLFQDALQYVMQHRQDPSLAETQAVPSPLANYILIHALLQRVLLSYHVIGPYDNGLMKMQNEIMRNALHAWTSLWQRAPESSLDPRNPNGPVTFTSTAILGVAYIRLSFNLGSHKILRSRNKDEIAIRLLRIPGLPSGPHLLPAALHATHALSIPVKLGVSFVARSHAFVWSVQHSLCGFEFAIFLSKWLYCLAECQTRRSLDEHEARLVSWISDIVEEGRASGDDDFWPRPSNPADCAYLGFAVVKLWARLIRGNEQWSLLGVIGDALDIYADTCAQEFMTSQTASLEPGQ
ncbi:hypothetical protein BJY00DRAFT_296793 [Aspergillus carlsbadensis]|nr:hypothetical protein BJY00DRAFT_296793 [Aspergillus carlsbadensis]